MASRSKVNPSPVTSSAKNPSSKSSPFPTPKKQPNTLQVDLSSKLASNGKLTSDKCKKYLKNNLCLYCGTRDHRLDFCPKKQTSVIPKGCNASATTDTLTVAFEKPLEKYRAIPRTLHKLRAVLNFLVQQQVWSDSTHLLFLILIHSLFLLPLPWFLVRITLIKSHFELLSTLGLLIVLETWNLWILTTWRHLQLLQLLSACLMVYQTAPSLKLPTCL